jgi:DNA replicative helicase MCM subunit Mcm2 (Cdc46/Mcm family)
VPRTIDCELTQGMVYQCNTGDVVTITGIVKVTENYHYIHTTVHLTKLNVNSCCELGLTYPWGFLLLLFR